MLKSVVLGGSNILRQNIHGNIWNLIDPRYHLREGTTRFLHSLESLGLREWVERQSDDYTTELPRGIEIKTIEMNLKCSCIHKNVMWTSAH